ncbi:hypothetical protein SESBI_01888 [Sesbania bispinosa]|nr:hypothetical protein SESBI_01888 [Sesbania bispinosa]
MGWSDKRGSCVGRGDNDEKVCGGVVGDDLRWHNELQDEMWATISDGTTTYRFCAGR